MRRRVDVKASASEAYGELQLVATKTYERRTVPIPRSLIDELAAQIAGGGPTDFVWESPHGGPFRYSNWFKRHFKPAVIRAGLPAGTRFHDLSHSYAAMLIAQGAHPRAIMERMGHSTITVTLDTVRSLVAQARRRARRRPRRHVSSRRADRSGFTAEPVVVDPSLATGPSGRKSGQVCVLQLDRVAGREARLDACGRRCVGPSECERFEMTDDVIVERLRNPVGDHVEGDA